MKLPLADLLVGTENEVVANPFSGDSVELTPDAVAVYDFIMGSERFGFLVEERRTCIDWFIENYPNEYMVLLD